MSKETVVETLVAELVDTESTEISVSGLSNSKEVLAVYTSERGLVNQVNQVKDLVDNFEHNMANLKGRNMTKSLASKIGKFKAKLEKTGKALADNEKARIEDVQATIKLINKNIKDMSVALAELKVKARQPLTDWEAEKEAKKQAKIEAERLEKLALLHENALFMNKEFDAQKLEVEKALAEKAELDRIEEEKRIAEKAIQDAKLEAERIAKETAEKEARLKQEKLEAEANAIHYWYHAESDDCGYVVGSIERDKIHSSVAEICSKEVYDKCMQQKAEQARIEQDKINAENLRIKQENEAKQEELAKQKRLLAESIKREEQQKNALIEQNRQAEQLRLNNEYIAQVCGDLKRSIMLHSAVDNIGCTERQARQIVISMRDGKINTNDFYNLFPR